MGLFSNVIGSWKKSSKLRALQVRIAAPGRSMDDVVANFKDSLRDGGSDRDKALEEFLDLCEADEGIRGIMKMEGLSREDLKKIYARLSAAGLGQWIKGHYAALSTIAYPEPLIYVVRAEKRGVKWIEIVGTLLQYWENEIPQGQLLRSVS